MKILAYVFVLVLLFIGGYALQPMITPLIVKDQEVVLDVKREIEVDGKNIAVDLTKITAAELPDTLILDKAVSMESEDGTMNRSYESGQAVKVLELKGDKVLVADPGAEQFKMRVPVGETNIFELVAQKQVELDAQRMAEAKAAAEVAEKARQAKIAAAKAAQGGGEAVAKNGGMSPDAPAPEMASNGGSEPAEKAAPQTPEKEEPAPEPASSGPVDPDQIVALMQESIKGGAIKEFTFDQVEEWKAGEEETVDGVPYQTGIAGYQAETIFGVKTVQAKALIKNGKVARWVYAKTGMEIR
ncbi:MAG: hypothetical protein ACQKBY_09570 [Verrucomicrobiales bacterium]